METEKGKQYLMPVVREKCRVGRMKGFREDYPEVILSAGGGVAGGLCSIDELLEEVEVFSLSFLSTVSSYCL